MSESARLITINSTSIDDALVADAGAALAEGRLVAIPTETVYGLGCNALDPDAIAGVFEAKGRPASDPLIVHVDGVAMADTLIEGGLPTVAARLAAAFWPGPLTMVLPKTEIVPDAITSGGPTVGVRCPAHPVARALITASGVPVAAPSANRFGRISPTTAAHVVEELGDRIDLIVDAGPADHGVESTVVTFEGDEAVILRHGALTAEALADHVAVREVGEADAEARTAAPGHDLRHYSPRTPAIATTTTPGDATEGDIVYVAYDDRAIQLPGGWSFFSLGDRSDLELVARNLYANLRRLDAAAHDLIVIELTDAAGIGRAIDDRLTRAASGVVTTTDVALAGAVAEVLQAKPSPDPRRR
ncbi:MAG: L-threonylcarbamoyladenylate synthase [Acidimicrobiales bacterium]